MSTIYNTTDLTNNTNNQHSYGSFFSDSEYRQIAITSLLLLVLILTCILCCCYWDDRRNKRKKNQFKQPKNQLNKLTFVQFPMSIENQGISKTEKRRDSSSLHNNTEIDIELPPNAEVDDEVIGSTNGKRRTVFTLDMDAEEKNRVECDEFLAKAEDNSSLLEEKYSKSEISS